MDAQSLLQNIEAIEHSPGVDSVVVARNGKLVAEGYFNGYGRDTMHDVRSASKSITSALAGIAIDQGLLTTQDTLGDSVYQLDRYDNWEVRKGSVKLIDLLHMSSGLACNDWVGSSPGNEEKMYRSADWPKFVLDLPMVTDPGEHSSYCTGGVVLLGSIIATQSGMRLDEFAATYLFNPIGIQTVEWRRSPDGSATGGGGMRLKPRDAAKFGSLYLDGGMWLGSRVLSESWVIQSQERVTTLGADAYGLLWWKRKFVVRGAEQECLFASGNGGNYIFVLPSERMVVVFTGSNYNSQLGGQPIDLLPAKILSTLR
jgi:CubicO group peptidase (beta-lactamase class C family)